MSDRQKRLEQKGYPLEYPAPKPGAMIEPFVIEGNLCFVSGHVSIDVLGQAPKYVGKIPSQVSLEDAIKSAELCAANLIRALHFAVGLDRVERIIRLTGYVNADPTFTEEHLVINGASQLINDVFGPAGRHARSALGMAQLPLGTATEVELIARIRV